MKNTLIIDPNTWSCDCLENLADGSNSIFVEFVGNVSGFEFKISSDNDIQMLELQSQSEKQYVEIPTAFIKRHNLSSFTIIGAGAPIWYFEANDINLAYNMIVRQTDSNHFEVATKFRKAISFDTIYPVGSIYMSVINVNPSSLFGGSWEVWGSGRVPVGVDTSQTEFAKVQQIGGTKLQTLSTANLPEHTHGSKALTGTISSFVTQGDNFVGASGIVSRSKDGKAYKPSTMTEAASAYDKVTISATHEHTSVGSGTAHNNLQPYITCYMWRRTA